MVSLMRRRAMMQAAEAEDSDITISKLNHSVVIQNGRSATGNGHYLLYHDDVILRSYVLSSLAAGATSTVTNFATDGKRFWLMMNGCKTVQYNGSDASYRRNGNYFEIDIPSDYDESIPFIFS